MSVYDKTLTLTETELTTVDLAILFPYNRVKVTSSLPAWFINNLDLGGYSATWDITPPANATYTYNYDVYLLDEPTKVGTGVLTLKVADKFENIDNCCSDENINIVWINRQGGYSNFIFTQRKDFTVSIDTTRDFITNDVKRYSEIRNVFNGVTVYVTGISKNSVNYLDTLRYSIQAWEYVNNNGIISFVPIQLEVKSFNKYNTKNNMYDISLSFIYATRLNVQRQ